jgi:RNA polymerase sigma-70 factor (ECF subfamily)
VERWPPLATGSPVGYSSFVESEENLVANCRIGNAEAWDELFERYYPVAGRFIFQLSPALSPEDADEICQDVFLAVIRNIASFEGASSFQTWLFRIAINKTRDFVGKQRAAKRGGGEIPLSLNAENPETGLMIDPPAQSPSPDGVLMNGERMFLVREALDQLGDPCREIIELKYFGDLSYEEIAAELNMNPKTVSSRLSKCLDKLEEIARPMFQRENMTPTSV